MHFPVSISEATTKWTYWDYFRSYSIDNQRIIGRSIDINGTTIVLLLYYRKRLSFYSVFHFGYSHKAFRL